MNEVYFYDIFQANGSTGYFSVPIKVLGFWSTDSIRVYGDCRGCFSKKSWQFSITHSSGGRDTKEVECDGEASINFGKALIAAGELVKTFRSPEFIAKLDKEFEEYVAKRDAMEKEEQERKEAAIAADPAIGESVAKEFLENLNSKEYISAIPRGENENSYRACKFKVVDQGNRSYYKNGSRISKKEAIKQLAEFSERSYVKSVA